MKDEKTTLAKRIKEMKFGQFLFLYLVARNSGDTMTNEVLEELKTLPMGKTKMKKCNKTPSEE